MIGNIIGAYYFSVMGLGKNFVIQLGDTYGKIIFIGVFFISFGATVVLLTVGTIPFLG
ncbi:hypothetical protein ACTQ54_04900 [Fundicoccus sp. Sow4_H7]|uniref:hypothetical protein n=1 Tax=Fundicoccus sp. Sow4_H7 TaxID=3438784 RepID=UPI003F9009CB